MIENLLSEFVDKTAERFNLSFEDALAAVSQTKVANDIAANGLPKDCSEYELYSDLFHEISNGL